MIKIKNISLETKICKICEEKFHKLPSHSKKYWEKRKFCSVKCTNMFFKQSEIYKGNTWGFKKGQVSSFKNKHHTEVSNQKNREKHVGKPHPNMLGNKFGLGYRHTPETIKKIKEARKHQNPHTYEARIKIRESRLYQIFPKKDTKPERFLQSILSVNGIKYKTHVPLMGQPDIFIEPNICVFVDGCYWHGCPEHFPNRMNEKDTIINEKLIRLGYKVIRFWEHEINQKRIDLRLLKT